MSATVVDYSEPSETVSPLEKHKMVLLGDPGCGKTSIITRFMYGSFDSAYQSTIGIDFLSKTLMVGKRPIRLQLWDTAGQERFRSLIPSYIRDSSVAAIVFDVTNRLSFNNVTQWYADVANQHCDCLVLLVGNKIDLVDMRDVTSEEGERKAAEMKAVYIEMSAKTGINVDTLFKKVVAALPEPTDSEESLERQKYIRINVDSGNGVQPPSTCNC